MGSGQGAKRSVRIAALQLEATDDVQVNLDAVGELLREASADGVDMAFLPENLAFMGAHDDDKLEHAEDEGDGAIQARLAEFARRHGCWIVAGSIPLRSPDRARCYGASICYAPDGSASRTYRKIHLFDVDLPDRDERYRESATMAPGGEIVVVRTPAGPLGLSICYDLRFPELYRRLVEEGATVFSIPAAFTAATGAAHWHTLNRARAIENLAFVVAAAQCGTHPGGRQTYGHSMIVDPWGRVLADLADGVGMAVADIDPALPGRLRAEFPVLEHRRIIQDKLRG